MAYLDSFLLPCAGYGWQGGPEFKTTIVEMRNGRERRNADIAYARHSFTAPFLNIDRSKYAQIKQGHLVARGMLHSFKFRDELDFEAEDEIFGQGDGVEDTFQLRKVSTIDGVSYIRETYVIEDDSEILVGGAPAPHTVDQDRGLVTFTTPPADGALLRGSWRFALWVRFNQDNLPFSIDNVNAINGAVSLIEVPPPPLP
jgi:uncharacterized protein (TIGR02217 family)